MSERGAKSPKWKKDTEGINKSVFLPKAARAAASVICKEGYFLLLLLL